jgi:hypothetical protein
VNAEPRVAQRHRRTDPVGQVALSGRQKHEDVAELPSSRTSTS